MAFNFPVGSAGKPAPKKKAPMAAAPMPQEMEGQEPEDGAQIAEQHGPATEVNVMHQHEAGMHHVTSHHPDGHMHESDHGSAEEAHEHAKKLAGAGSGHSEEPDGEEDW
jgi:hypothetical protein